MVSKKPLITNLTDYNMFQFQFEHVNFSLKARAFLYATHIIILFFPCCSPISQQIVRWVKLWWSLVNNQVVHVLSTYLIPAFPLSLNQLHFSLKRFFFLFFFLYSASPKKSTPPQRLSRKEKETRSRPSLIDLPLPPTLPGGDSSPPQSPIRHAPSLPQPPLKKRPKSVSFITHQLPVFLFLIPH